MRKTVVAVSRCICTAKVHKTVLQSRKVIVPVPEAQVSHAVVSKVVNYLSQAAVQAMDLQNSFGSYA